MDYDKIKYMVCDVYEICSINRLPFDCVDLISHMGYSSVKYSELSRKSHDACIQLSEDAHIIDNEIFYNDKRSKRRIRFSLMHELGHLLLDTQDEAEANNFASNILAPSIAVYYAGYKNIREISNLFDISLECARYAYETCCKWTYSTKQYGMNDIDKKLYNHFFDYEANRFVFKKSICPYCDTLIYNSNKPICTKCEKPQCGPLHPDKIPEDFLIAESQWLYRLD